MESTHEQDSMQVNSPRNRRAAWIRGGCVAAAMAVAASLGVCAPASAAPEPAGVMSSANGRTIAITLQGQTARACAPVVQELLLDGQAGFRWAPPTRTDGPPAYSVTVPNDGAYVIGAICRDESGESYSPSTGVVIGDAPRSGPDIVALPWVKPFANLPGDNRAVATTITTGNEPCGVDVMEMNYVGEPFRFRSERPEDFVAPHTIRMVSVLTPRAGGYMVVGTCGGYHTWPPQFVQITS